MSKAGGQYMGINEPFSRPSINQKVDELKYAKRHVPKYPIPRNFSNCVFVDYRRTFRAFWQASKKIWQNSHTSVYVLYRGAGATLITSGFLSSMITPCSSKVSRTLSKRPGSKSRLSCAPRSAGFEGVMMEKGLPPEGKSTG